MPELETSTASDALTAPATTDAETEQQTETTTETAASETLIVDQQQIEKQNGAEFDWSTINLSPEGSEFIQKKGFKTPDAVIESYRNLEKLAGTPAERILKLPDPSDAEGMRAMFEKLGAGKSPDDYKFPVPDGVDDTFSKTAAGWMHEIGVPVDMGMQLAEKYNTFLQEQVSAQQNEMKQRDQAQLVQLKADWGQNMQANTRIVDRAAETFGMKEDTIESLRQSMGAGEAMKFLLEIGSRLGVEDRFVEGEGAGFDVSVGGSPEQAKARIDELRKDTEFIKKYASGDIQSRREMERLHRIAYPEE